jgi:UDP-N-acetylglucosamine 3-dehydrogenase
MLKTAVIGVGVMGQNHTRIYSEISNLVGVYDTNLQASKQIAKTFNVQSFPEIDNLLSSDIDAISIATPSSTHHEISMKALQAGKNILVEKPFCSTAKEGEQIIKTAEKLDLTVGVGFIERHNPIIQYTKENIQKDDFGNIISMNARRVSSFPPRIKDIGVITDLATHDIDIMRFLSNSTVESVYVRGGGFHNSVFEDHAIIILNLENGITGYIEVNWLTPMKVRRLALTCSRSYVEIDYIDQSMTISSSKIMNMNIQDLYNTSMEKLIRHVQLKKQEPLRMELINFLDSIEHNRRPEVTGEDGLETLKITLAALQSLKTKEPVKLCNV